MNNTTKQIEYTNKIRNRAKIYLSLLIISMIFNIVLWTVWQDLTQFIGNI